MNPSPTHAPRSPLSAPASGPLRPPVAGAHLGRIPAPLLGLMVLAGLTLGCRSDVEEQPAAIVVGGKTGPSQDMEGRNFALGYSASGMGSPGAMSCMVSSSTLGRRFDGGAGREQYAEIDLHGFIPTAEDARRTFSVDVDTAAYANVRRFLNGGSLPPKDAVRLEEMLNYFRYENATSGDSDRFGVSIELADCPWNPAHRLARVGVSTQPIPTGYRRSANLVFLIDVSGSMSSADKLPLLKRSLHLLCQNLNSRDRVAIVVYAGAAGLVLPSTACVTTEPILASLSRLQAGGSTAGEAGIRLAYAQAREHFIPDGINRVILATDGDFNVGISNRDELVKLIQEEAADGVTLTALGFGSGNINDAALEQLADKGNGNYAYIDSIVEARKVLVEELGATLEVVAKDVKIQVTFDPERVLAHRLLGYENRTLAHADFEDDSKDAGEIGAGHGVTALFELVPVGADMPELDDREADPDATEGVFEGPGMMRVDLRYKLPEDGEDTSWLVSFHAEDGGSVLMTASDDLRFAAAVAWFAEELRSISPDPEILEALKPLAASSLGSDPGGWRAGFLDLVDQAVDAARMARETAASEQPGGAYWEEGSELQVGVGSR